MAKTIDFYDVVPAGPISMLAGHTAVIAFEIAPDDALDLMVMHTSDTSVQDWSLRAWVSPTVAGPPAVRYPISVCDWHPDRLGRHVVTVYDAKNIRPAAQFPLPLMAGRYYLCVESVANSGNAFNVRLTNRKAPDKPIS